MLCTMPLCPVCILPTTCIATGGGGAVAASAEADLRRDGEGGGLESLGDPADLLDREVLQVAGEAQLDHDDTALDARH